MNPSDFIVLVILLGVGLLTAHVIEKEREERERLEDLTRRTIAIGEDFVLLAG